MKSFYVLSNDTSFFINMISGMYCDDGLYGGWFMSYFGAKRRKGATRKPAKWWPFRVFAWRPFAPPHESTRHSMRCVFVYFFSYLCLSERKVAKRKLANRQNYYLAGFRVAIFRPDMESYDEQGLKRERSPRENPLHIDFLVFSHDDLSPRHTKVRDIPCIAFSATVCCIFAWRGKRAPCENPPTWPFGGFARGDLLRFRLDNPTWHKSATIGLLRLQGGRCFHLALLK